MGLVNIKIKELELKLDSLKSKLKIMNNSFLYALRKLKKNRTSSVISIIGLSVAFACVLLIFIYVSQEFSYNNFHKNRDKIFRLNYSIEYVDGHINESELLNPELSAKIKEQFPQIKEITPYRT